MRPNASFISVATAISLTVAALGGGMYVGALATDVEQLQAQEVQRQEDHDTIVALKENVDAIKDDVADIEEDVSDILTAIQNIQIHIERH